MAGRMYYLVSSLPSLGDLGSVPPLALGALREHAAETAGARDLVEAVLVGDDLLQRDAALAGEIETPEPSVLTVEQARGEQPLPAHLAAEADPAARSVGGDAVWAAYFRHAAAVARRRGSRFLADWVGSEVALRTALTTARAKALGLDPAGYLVAAELADPGTDFSELVTNWAAAANPLEGLRVLDRGRWQWLAEHEAWFSFTDDELAVYAARLVLLTRWHRMTAGPAAGGG